MCPPTATAATTSSRYELDLDYRVNSNRLTGKATITAVATQALSRISFDLSGLRVSKVSVNGRRAAALHPPLRQAARLARRTIVDGAEFTVDIQYGGNPEARGQSVGRAGLGGTHRGRDRRQPAERRGDLVPVQRPPRRQGALPDHDHHRLAVPGGRERAAGVTAGEGEPDHLGLRPGRADGDVPGNRADRPVRRCRAGRVTGDDPGRAARRAGPQRSRWTSGGSRT